MCKYTNGSIPPGQKGELTYSAPTKGRLGRFKKSITVIFSSGEHIVLITTGEVIGDSKATTKIDSVLWKETEFDFGEIPEGPDAVHTFRFTNNSKDTIRKISWRSPIKGWYIHDPVPPKGQGEIKMEYSTKDRIGPFKRSTSIKFSNGEVYFLTIKGTVILASEERE